MSLGGDANVAQVVFLHHKQALAVYVVVEKEVCMRRALVLVFFLFESKRNLKLNLKIVRLDSVCLPILVTH